MNWAHHEIKYIDLSRISKEQSDWLAEKRISLNCLKESLFLKNIDSSDLQKYMQENCFLDQAVARCEMAIDFQLEALSKSYITLLCPYTGKEMESNASIQIDPNLIVFEFIADYENKKVYLIQAGIGSGYPKLGIYLPAERMIISNRQFSLWGL